jgi:hypothetical protein
MWYRNGTVTVTNASAVVTGSGTNWLNQVKAGDMFTVNRTNFFEVDTVASNTSLTLNDAFSGTSGSGQAYAIIRNFTNTTSADLSTRILAVMDRYDTAVSSGGTGGGTSGGTTIINNTGGGGSNVCGVMIPWYLYPGDFYTNTTVASTLDIIREYRNVPTMIVINPSNGAGTATDGNYAAAIRQFKGAGAIVVGYVSSAYAGTIDATKTEAQVKADILAWKTIYAASPVDGIFIDEQPWEANSAWVALYKRYCDYCHDNGFATVVANPGTNQQPIWFQNATADVIIVHENGVWPSETDMKGNFTNGHAEFPTSMRAILIHGQSTLDVYKLRRMRRYVNWIYVTNDLFDAGNPATNPWDSIPPYLRQLYAELADQDGVGEGPTTLTSGSSIAWDAGETSLGEVTLAHNATLAAASNMIKGRTYKLIATQGGGGSWTLAFNATFYKFPTTQTLPLTGSAGQRHVIEFTFNGTVALATSAGTYPA